ncbi:hypothetical protein EUX98_g2644 [Antrodiella citrinella]|uniref:AB hydrolase-1 domain-containing protein n=1 Tax=Antrodiella citrinella TaxID=2447956 RepID=A0A4V6S1W9_9APHY|nr:hypothetical protein EUX98_g2644 [Antrodiella citrinella]
MALFQALLAVFVVSLFTPLVIRRAYAASFISSPYHRIELTIPVHVSTDTATFAYDTPQNQTQLTGLIQEAFSATSNLSALQIGTVPLVASYNIYAELFVPNGWNTTGTGVLEFTVHGLTLDHTYWYINGPGSDLNYVEASINAGNAIFVFDRLGNGKSDKPDGIKEVQMSVHIAVVEALISFLRNTGVEGFSFKRMVGVGHSYGSNILANLIAINANVFDALVLTGFTMDTQATPTVTASLAFAIASQVNRTAFGSLSNSYTTPESSINLHQAFFHFPDFPQSALDFLLEHRGVITVGEVLTLGQTLSTVVPNFTAPLLIVTADKDMCVSLFPYITASTTYFTVQVRM